MNNTPVMKIGIVAVSRDCFPESLSVTRRQNLVKAYEAKYGKGDIYECPVCIVESEIHMMQALEDIKNAGCNALCVYLGNFGPEIAETMLAKNFNGPKVFIAAAEGHQLMEVLFRDEAMLIVECLTQAIILSFVELKHIFRSILLEQQKNVQI